MKNESEQLEALKDIRRMMKESSRFLSLSGLSGVLAGVYALAGAAWAYSLTEEQHGTLSEDLSARLAGKLAAIACAVLGLSLATALYLSGRKARSNHHRLFDHTSRRLMMAMAVPLLCGGIFSLALLMHGGWPLISSTTLIFYGLALVSGSRYTLDDVRLLGYLQLLLGFAAAFWPRYGLLIWACGFGLLHIIYGSIMWYRHDRTKA